MKKVSRRELARSAAKQLLDGKDSQKMMEQLAAYLVEHKIAQQADMLISDIAVELQAATGQLPVTVRAPFALSADSQKRIASFLQQKTGAQSVDVTVVEDKTLLGGIVIRTPQHEYDASVRNKLNQLALGES